MTDALFNIINIQHATNTDRPMFYMHWPGSRTRIHSVEDAFAIISRQAYDCVILLKAHTFYLDIRCNIHAMCNSAQQMESGSEGEEIETI
jgi:hypothetical protein